MQPVQLAVATRCWKAPLPDILRAASELNVTGLQLDVREEVTPTSLTDTGRRDFLHRIRERELRIATTWVPLRHPLYSMIELERRLSFLREAMTFTWNLGARTLCFRCGRIPDDLDKGEGALLVELLSDLAVHGNHVGVVLAITPTMDSAARLKELVSRIKTGPVGIDFDPAHFAMVAEPAADALRTLHAEVVHVQLRDGMRDLAGGGVETPVGQGVIDWAEILALLGEMDYSGWLTALRTQGDDKPGDVARGLGHIRRTLYRV